MATVFVLICCLLAFHILWLQLFKPTPWSKPIFHSVLCIQKQKARMWCQHNLAFLWNFFLHCNSKQIKQLQQFCVTTVEFWWSKSKFSNFHFWCFQTKVGATLEKIKLNWIKFACKWSVCDQCSWGHMVFANFLVFFFCAIFHGPHCVTMIDFTQKTDKVKCNNQKAPFWRTWCLQHINFPTLLIQFVEIELSEGRWKGLMHQFSIWHFVTMDFLTLKSGKKCTKWPMFCFNIFRKSDGGCMLAFANCPQRVFAFDLFWRFCHFEISSEICNEQTNSFSKWS